MRLDRWQPSRGEWNRAAATHLLRRAGFGARPGEAERFVDQGLEASLEEVFARDEHEAWRVEGVKALLPTDDADKLAAWWMSLILAGGAPLRERVTLMWHDHFATSNDKVDDARLMYRQNQLFREQGLGDFRELLHATAKDPAMLVWLDGNSNRRGQANENFAREVMELFALGIGNYTEHDVQEAARAFTGWGTQGRSFVFRESQHDPGEKVILGRRGSFGGEQALDLILEHPACARHVARRLLQEFVAPTPEPQWIEEAAAVLLACDWNIGLTIAAILSSELFFAPEARRSRIAAPVELLAMSVCALDARVSPQEAAQAAARMGQSLYRPPSVKGWDGMRTWINAGTWVARHNTLAGLARAHVEEAERVRVDLRATFGDPELEDVPTTVAGTLLPDVRNAALDEVLAEAAASAPGVGGDGEVDDADRALALVTALILTSPEYQLT